MWNAKQYYVDNPEKNKQRLVNERRRYRRRMYWIARYKLAQGCQICGYNKHPAALQFDHLHSKEFHVTTKVMARLSKLFTEIRKCRILCANCHATQTHSDNVVQK